MTVDRPDTGHASDSTLRASVVIMTFDRPEALRRCLTSLAAQTMPRREFEVVVVDVSTPPVTAVIAEFASRLTLVHHPASNGGVAANRNVGARVARGHVLAFLDDDCRAHPAWLATLAATVEANPKTIAASPAIHEAPRTAVAAAGQVITDAVHEFFNPEHAAPRFLPGLNFAIERQAYVALGGCDESYGRLAAEDRDLVDRWRMQGGTLTLCADTPVHHDHRATLRGFVRQYVNYGRGAWRYHRSRRARRSGHMRDDIALHVSLPTRLRGLMRRVPPDMRVSTLCLLMVWQLANAAGFAWQAVSDTVLRSANGEQ